MPFVWSLLNKFIEVAYGINAAGVNAMEFFSTLLWVNILESFSMATLCSLF
jgi:hypothetical protein